MAAKETDYRYYATRVVYSLLRLRCGDGDAGFWLWNCTAHPFDFPTWAILDKVIPALIIGPRWITHLYGEVEREMEKFCREQAVTP